MPRPEQNNLLKGVTITNEEQEKKQKLGTM